MRKGYIQQKPDQEGQGKGKGSGMGISAKTEKLLREYALKQIFGQLQNSKKGNHKTAHIGNNHENAGQLRPFEFGDPLERIEMTESLKNAQINSGLSDFHKLTVTVLKTYYKKQEPIKIKYRSFKNFNEVCRRTINPHRFRPGVW